MKILRTITTLLLLISFIFAIYACSGKTPRDPVVPDPPLEDPVDPDPPRETPGQPDPSDEDPEAPAPPDEEPDDPAPPEDDPDDPDPEGDTPVDSGQIILTLLPDDGVTIETVDFEYDMDFDWDDGLIITNNSSTIYDFAVHTILLIEGEPESYSAGIIEKNMTTAALGIPLVEGKNVFTIFIRDEPSHILLNGFIYEVADWSSDDVVKAPDGLHEYIKNQVIFLISNDTEASERHRIFREYNLFIIGCFIKQVDTSYVGRIDDGRCPIDVADELNTEEEVLHASEHGVFRSGI